MEEAIELVGKLGGFDKIFQNYEKFKFLLVKNEENESLKTPYLFNSEKLIYKLIEKKSFLGDILRLSTERIRKNKKLALGCVEDSPSALQYFHEDVKNDLRIALKIIKKDIASTKYVGEKLRSDPQFFIKYAIKLYQPTVGYITDVLKNNEKFFEELIKKDAYYIRYAGDEICNNSKIILRFMEISTSAICILDYAGEKLIGDVSFRKKAEEMLLKRCGRFECPSWHYKSRFCDWEVPALAVIITWPDFVKELSDRLKNDKKFLLRAVQTNFLVFKNLDEKYKKDREFMLNVLNVNGKAYEFLTDDLKSDREIILIAVGSNGIVLENVPKEFKSDREIITKAIENKAFALRYADPNVKYDQELVKTALKNETEKFNEEYNKLKKDTSSYDHLMWKYRFETLQGYWLSNDYLTEVVMRYGEKFLLRNIVYHGTVEKIFKGMSKEKKKDYSYCYRNALKHIQKSLKEAKLLQSKDPIHSCVWISCKL